VAELIFARLPQVFPGVTFDLLTADRAPRLSFRNVFNASGWLAVLRLLLRLCSRYDLVVVCGAGEKRFRFARVVAFLLMRPQAPMFVFSEFAEGFWLDRAHWSDIRSHLQMRHGGSKAPLLFRLRWKNLIGALGLLVILPLIALRALVLFVMDIVSRLNQSLGRKRATEAPLQPAAVLGYQSIENQRGEISYRQGASFGEPEKAMEDVRERIEARRGVFERLRTEGRLDGPFLEIGAGVSQTALMLRNEFGVNGAATDTSLHALQAADEIASRIGYPHLPLRICCDARWLPFQDQVFPLAYCFQTLHHFADPAPILAEVRRVLAPGGHFFLSEEPIRRALCLNLYRCERLEDLNGFDKWLFDIGLLRYIAEAYVGSKPESMWGIMENQGISVRQWDRALSVFDEVDLDASNLFAEDARVLREWLVQLGLPRKKVERLTAGLFGAELSGICRVLNSAPDKLPQSPPGDLRELCRCPECHRPLRFTSGSSHAESHVAATAFECPNCGPFPQEQGVHLLFRQAQLEALYRPPADAAVFPQAPSPGTRSPEARARKGRSPHPLVEGAEIARVRLLNARGDEVSRVASGEETVVAAWIECSRPLAHPIVGLRISRTVAGKPTVIYDTNTMWQHLSTGEFSPGDVIEARFCQRMNLGPGSYSVTVAIASHDTREFYDWQEDILSFRVADATGMQGIVNLRSEIVVARKPPAVSRQQSTPAPPAPPESPATPAPPAPWTLRISEHAHVQVLNPDGCTNLAAVPAPRGSVIQIFVEGTADTLPP
jgi:ubiquinone/menaquinone biosynthesis C-methylase UbiE